MVQPSWLLMFLQPSFPKYIFFLFVNFYQICSDSIHFLLKGCFKLHAEFLLIFLSYLDSFPVICCFEEWSRLYSIKSRIHDEFRKHNPLGRTSFPISF